MMGIYKITNVLNDRPYIGKSVNIEQRWKDHKSSSRPVEIGGDNCAIHQAIRKYGIENFSFEILEITTADKLNEREKYWIDFYNSYNNGYNCTIGGDGQLKYDYKEILNLWQQGRTGKEITQLLNCDDEVVTNALHSYNITEEKIRRRSNNYQNKPIVAIDIKTGQPLKIFSCGREACLLINGNLKNKDFARKSIIKHYRCFGYYWEYLTEKNHPKRELSNEEFLSYKELPLITRSQELKETISISNRKVDRCDRNTLKNLIRTQPFTKIAEQYHVSDNAIRKWCINYGLPFKKSDIKKISDEDWINI